MVRSVINALGQIFRAAPDVRTAGPEHEHNLIFQEHPADLVVQTWMGSRIYVYLFDDAPRVRSLKQILRTNTRDGIGTLFVIDGELLPGHDQNAPMNDWQEALRAVNDGWIYSYQVQDGELQIRQVHFADTMVSDQYYIWHLDDFSIESVTVRRRDIGANIKGAYAIADIASSQYKRRINSERVNQRFHYKTKTTHEVASAPVDVLRECYQQLGVTLKASEQDVKRAYRRMAMQLHPDVSPLPKPEAERRFKLVTEAYERIKRHHGWS